MSETNFSYMEVSAKRKKRNQFISILIVISIILLGVIVWGWIELQENSKAERIKNALNSQVEPAAVSEDTLSTLAAIDSEKIVVQDTPTAVVEELAVPVVPTEPAIKAPEKEATAKPEKVNKPVTDKVESPSTSPVKTARKQVPKKNISTPIHEPMVASTPVEPEPTPMPTVPKSQPTPKPVVVAATPITPPAPPIAAIPTPVPNPGASAPTAKPAPPAPAKAFPPEDLPLSTKSEPTEDVKLALATTSVGSAIPKAAGASASGQIEQSAPFKQGVAAYQQQDYVNAIRSFTAIPKPPTKKRGTPDREEFVQGNFLKGLALLKVGHMSEAVSAFKNVLEYEKYYPLANMNLGICYVELKQYAKAHQAFEAVVRDQSFIDPAAFDDVMQRTKYFWALAWTRLYKNSTNVDKQNFFRQQAILKWKDYDVWFSKNEKYKSENVKAENYLKSLSSL